jgi:hypothetical protein
MICQFVIGEKRTGNDVWSHDYMNSLRYVLQVENQELSRVLNAARGV